MKIPSFRLAVADVCTFGSAFDDAPVGLCLVDRDLHFIEVNAAFARLYGLDESTLRGKHVSDIFPDLGAQIRELSLEALLSDDLVQREITLVGRQMQGPAEVASKLVYLSNAWKVHGERGDTIGIAVVLTDITEQHKVTAAWIDRHDLRSPENITPHIPWTANASGLLASMSTRWNALTGAKGPSASLKSWAEVLHPGDVNATAEAWAASLSTGFEYDVEHRISTANGEWLWVRARARPLKSADDEIIRWYGTVEDIHDRKVKEIKLVAAIEELQRGTSEDQLTSLPTRMQFNESVATEIGRARRTKRPLAIILLSIDHFDKFVEVSGRLAADECLRAIANSVSAVLRRPADSTARFSAHEFAIVLPETDVAGAREVVQRALNAIGTLTLICSDIRVQRLTCSAGVVVNLREIQSSTALTIIGLLQAADAALHKAKAEGGNRYSVTVV